MKKILCLFAVAIVATSTAFAGDCGSCDGKKKDKKESTTETATISLKL